MKKCFVIVCLLILLTPSSYAGQHERDKFDRRGDGYRQRDNGNRPYVPKIVPCGREVLPSKIIQKYCKRLWNGKLIYSHETVTQRKYVPKIVACGREVFPEVTIHNYCKRLRNGRFVFSHKIVTQNRRVHVDPRRHNHRHHGNPALEIFGGLLRMMEENAH